MQKHEDYILNNILILDELGRIKRRERADLEFKESFNLGSAAKYAKIMASFANNLGGYIIFGVKDKPREIIGVNSKFSDFNQEKLEDTLNSYFSPAIDWESGEVQLGSKRIGYIYVNECLTKPVIAIKGDGATIGNGDIFYRYKARTEKIKYPELNKLITDRQQQLAEQLMKVVESLKNNKTTSIGIIDYNNGHITTPYGVDFQIEKRAVLNILRQAKYIKSGSFTENGGKPVLRVTGNIDLAEEIPVPDMNPNEVYPYIQKDLKDLLNINNTQHLYALIWYYQMKQQSKFHFCFNASRKQQAHKFSEHAKIFLEEKINEHQTDYNQWIEGILVQFNEFNKKKRKETNNG